MLRMSKVFSGFFCLSLGLIASSASAEECDPAKFLIEDIENSNLDLVTASQLAITGSSSWNNSRTNSLVGRFTGQDGSGSANMATARNYGRRVQSAMNYSLNTHEQRYLFRSALSSNGVRAYESCVNGLSNRLSVEIPAQAARSSQFPLKVKWRVNTPESGRYRLKAFLLNGELVDGSEFEFGPNQETALLLRGRNQNANSSLIFRVVRLNSDGSETQMQAEFVEIPPSISVSTRYQRLETEVTATGFGFSNEWGIGRACFTPSSPNSFLLPRSASFRLTFTNHNWNHSFSTQEEEQVCILLRSSTQYDRDSRTTGTFSVTEVFYELVQGTTLTTGRQPPL